MQNVSMEVIIFVVCLLALLFILRFFKKSLRFLIRLFIHACGGGMLLVLLNTFGAQYGVALAVNPVTMLLSGMLGIPGVAALLLVRFLLHG